MQPTLVAHGHQILGHFVAELTPNDYPRPPVIQDPRSWSSSPHTVIASTTRA